MIKFIWAVVCERISIEQSTNSVSYLTCIEGVTVTQLPAAVLALALGSRWFKTTNEKVKIDIRLDLLAPDNRETRLIEGDQTIEMENHRIFFQLNGLTFDVPGIYKFRLSFKETNDWIIAQEIPLTVILAPKEPKNEIAR